MYISGITHAISPPTGKKAPHFLHTATNIVFNLYMAYRSNKNYRLPYTASELDKSHRHIQTLVMRI